MESTHFDFSGMEYQNMDFGIADGGVMADEQQSFLKPAEGNTNAGFFFGGDEGIETTTSSHFDMGSAAQSFDSMNTDLFSVPQETFGMQPNLNLGNTMVNAPWTSQLSPTLDDFVMPTPAQTFASLYQPQASSNKRSLELDTQDFPQSKRQESADFAAFSPFATSNSVAGSTWTMENIMTPSSSNDIGLTDEAADVCATWFSKYAILPSDRHVESLSQLTGESANAIRHWFGQMLKQGMAGHDSAYKSQTSLSQQDQPSTVASTSFPCVPETQTSTTQPTSTRSKQRCTPTNNPELLERDEKKIYQCTRKCGKRYGRKCDWKRNEEEGYPSKSWMCSLCISLGVENVKPCYRKYHFSQHFRNIHPGLNSDEYEAASVVHSDTSFPRKCGFCTHRFVSRQERIDHLAEHFKKGKCMLDWNVDEDENTNGSDNNDEDDDNDSDDRHDSGGSDDNSSSPSDQSGNNDRGGRGPKNGNGGGDHSDRPHPPGGYSKFSFSQFKQNGDVPAFSQDLNAGPASDLQQGVPKQSNTSQRPCIEHPTLSVSGQDHHDEPHDQQRVSCSSNSQQSSFARHSSPTGDDTGLVARNALPVSTMRSLKSTEVVIDNHKQLDDSSQHGQDVNSSDGDVDLDSIVDNLLRLRSTNRNSSSLSSLVAEDSQMSSSGVAANTAASSIFGQSLLQDPCPPILLTSTQIDPETALPPPLSASTASCEARQAHAIANLDQVERHDQLVLQTTLTLAPAKRVDPVDVLGRFAPIATDVTGVDLNALWSLFRVKTSRGSLTEQDKALAKLFISQGMPLGLNSTQLNNDFITAFLQQLEKMPQTSSPRLVEIRNPPIFSLPKVEILHDVAQEAAQTLSSLSKLINERVPSFANAWKEIDPPTVQLYRNSQSFVSVKLLGSGGFSTVDEVVHRETSLRVSRKTLKNRTESALEELQKEVAVLQKLRHPHIVRFLGAYAKGDKVSILLSPVAETTLAVWLQTASIDKPGHLPDTIVKMFGCLISSVRYLHEQRPVVKHMDIKPQNILVMHGDQEFPHVVLSDFGISSTNATEDEQEAKPLTRKYCAPEVPQGNSRERAADIWSLGCVFLEMALAAFGNDDLQWVGFRAEFCDLGSKYYWQDVPRLQESLTTFVLQATDLCEATVFHTVKSMLNGSPDARPDAARLTMIFTPAPCCLDWANDKQSFPGPIEELRNVAMLVHEEGLDCPAPFCQRSLGKEAEGSQDDSLTDQQRLGAEHNLGSCSRASVWLQECSHNHDACRRSVNDHILPTRLLDVQPDGIEGSFVRIVNSSDITSGTDANDNIDYAVICQQWGASDVTLSQERLASAGMNAKQQDGNLLIQRLDLPRDILSRSLDNAISVASRTGHRFVWVDSLCVMQDSEEEKQRECVTMASIYRGANLTIVANATNSKCSREGSIAKDQAAVPQHPLDWCSPGFAWDTRAWSLQERLLSSRLLHLAGEQMYWECNSLKASETFPEGLPTLVWEKVHTRSSTPSTPSTPSTTSSPSSKPTSSLLRDCMLLRKEEDGSSHLLPSNGTQVNDGVHEREPVHLSAVPRSSDEDQRANNIFQFDFEMKIPVSPVRSADVHANHAFALQQTGKETHNQCGSQVADSIKSVVDKGMKNGNEGANGAMDVDGDLDGMRET